MKKIIYSLVIMIAAGSLFTSCIENTEPDGVKTLRQAKADYLLALSNLRAADAEKVKAEAAVEQANAAYRNAEAALQQALAKAQELANELAAANNEKSKAQIEAAIDSIKVQAEKDAMQAEADLAQAEVDLEKALADIAVQAETLSQAERDTIKGAMDKLIEAQRDVNAAKADVRDQEFYIFSLEYDKAAGYDTIGVGVTTVVDWQDSIDIANEGIAYAQEYIEMLKNHEGIVDTEEILDSLDDQMYQLEEDSLKAYGKKALYEAVELPKANDAFAEKWDAYVKDSIPALMNQYFAYDPEEGVYVNWAYKLTDGQGLDQYFRIFVNSQNLNKLGVKVSDDAKSILVGMDDTDNPAKLDSINKAINVDEVKEDGLAGLLAITEALNRDLVVLKDSAAVAENIQHLEDALEDADSIYTAHRNILDSGLTNYAPLKAANAALAEANTALTTKKGALTTALGTAHTDSVAYLKAISDAGIAYKAATKSFVTMVNGLRAGAAAGTMSPEDTTNFVAAIVALGQAQQNFLGTQDTVRMMKWNENSTELVPYAVNFSDLTAADFKVNGNVPTAIYNVWESTYGTPTYSLLYSRIGNEYGDFAKNTGANPTLTQLPWYEKTSDKNIPASMTARDGFLRVVNVAISQALATQEADGVAAYAWGTDLTTNQIGTGFDAAYADAAEAKMGFDLSSCTTAADSIQWYRTKLGAAGLPKASAALVAADATHKADTAAVNAAIKDTLAAYKAINGVETGDWDPTKACAKTNVAKAEKEYENVYNSFWGYTAGTALPATELPLDTWSLATFTEYDGEKNICVFFDGNIINTNKLGVICEMIYRNSGLSGAPSDLNDCFFFKHDTNTELTKLLAAAWDYELASDVMNITRLQKINEVVDQICDDYDEFAAAVEENANAYVAAVKALGEDPTTFDPTADAPEIDDAWATEDGEWAATIKGYKKDFAEEVAAEYPAIVGEYKAAHNEFAAKLGYLQNINDVIEDLATKMFNLEKEFEEDNDHFGGYDYADWDAVLAAVDAAIEDLEDMIEELEDKIVVYEKCIALDEAGYDPLDVKIAAAKEELEILKKELENAEDMLAIAQDYYDKVMDQYLSED